MISVQRLSIRMGAFSLTNVSFSVPAGAYAVLMGRTGSGKTTLVEAICGLRSVLAGKIILGDVDVTDLRPGLRRIGYVPQDGALFTSMTVRQNIGFALDIQGRPQADIDLRVNALAGMLGINHLLPRKATGLSGGEIQRIALGRALAANPPVLLLDEPLSALDDQTRLEMYDLLATVRKQTGVTALHVTHNAADAQRLADLVLSLRDGNVVEDNHEFERH